MSEPNETPAARPDGTRSTRVLVVWGVWQGLLLVIAVAGAVLADGVWRWVWLALLVGIVVTTWLSRPWRTVTVPAALREPGDHRVVLQLPGDKPVRVVAALRRITGADLVTARNLVQSTPVVVAENLSQESAAQAAHLLQRAGARAVISPMDDAP
jgi:hypothetical protein